MKHARRIVALSLLSGVGAYVAGSWLAGRRLAGRLTAAAGLAPVRARREDLLAALKQAGAAVGELRHHGHRHDPVSLSAVFASPDEDPSRRPTILFLHGKGGNAAEWSREAVRAVACGYNVLIPDLRGHGASGGRFVTYGFLELDDLENAIAAARDLFGIDPLRLGIHGCSAGATLAIAFAAGRDGVRAAWLESPWADPLVMARHYLALGTRLPEALLGLTARFAVRRSIADIRRSLALEKGTPGLASIDPAGSMRGVHAAVCLVYGEVDRLVPPRFVARIEEALPPGSRVWRTPGAGHCHHDNEAGRVAEKEYDNRWREFFEKNLPIGG